MLQLPQRETRCHLSISKGAIYISLSGKERANLVEQCLVCLKDVGVHCVSLTCDGPSCHFTMLKALGASMTLPNLEPSFSRQQSSCICSVRHMPYAKTYKEYFGIGSSDHRRFHGQSSRCKRNKDFTSGIKLHTYNGTGKK